ncbi:MAG: hypothetical protein JO184_15545 [Gammaproteobacteria bacterium]|nr:hypothetical protein [Gammaproteobacteria bacterium]MBV8405074.1 hypothetical protein [Gammaproteobacteria bacterium]
MFKRFAVAVMSWLAIGGPAAQASPPSGSVKDWSFRKLDGDRAIASTGNGSGSSLGVYCVAKRDCQIYLATDTGCEDARTYTLLLNASSAAFALSSTCHGISNPGEKQRFVFFLDDFNTVLATMMKDHTVGFAIPVAGEQFKVTRFSLEGSNEALAALSSLLKDGKPKPAVSHDRVL